MAEGERPTIGLWPKLLIGALALFGLLTLLSWLVSWIFGAARLLLVVAVVVILVQWVTHRSKDEP